ncbi:MAG: twin-arginine translocase subunit TatC [Desulfobulbaceae bacterium]|nr:twin-arginine translocase subunit TatC [Desulfobulbaceae bacterium]
MIKELALYAPHHQELRQRLIVCISAVAVCAVAAYLFIDPIINLLLKPLYTAYPQLDKLVYTKLTEAFIVYLKVALFAGLFLAFPVIIHQIWMFVAPGLKDDEKSVARRIIFWSTLLFVSGAFFSYEVVLPKMLKFFMGYAGPALQPMLKFGFYLTFASRAIFAFALAFEIPFLMVMAMVVGLVSDHHFRKKRRYFYVVIITLAFLLTAGEIVATMLLSLPLFGLYESGIVVGNFIVTKNNESADKGV